LVLIDDLGLIWLIVLYDIRMKTSTLQQISKKMQNHHLPLLLMQLLSMLKILHVLQEPKIFQYDLKELIFGGF